MLTVSYYFPPILFPYPLKLGFLSLSLHPNPPSKVIRNLHRVLMSEVHPLGLILLTTCQQHLTYWPLFPEKALTLLAFPDFTNSQTFSRKSISCSSSVSLLVPLQLPDLNFGILQSHSSPSLIYIHSSDDLIQFMTLKCHPHPLNSLIHFSLGLPAELET